MSTSNLQATTDLQEPAVQQTPVKAPIAGVDENENHACDVTTELSAPAKQAEPAVDAPEEKADNKEAIAEDVQAPVTTDEKPEACETKETKAPEEEQEKSAAEAEEPKEAATDAQQATAEAIEF